MKKIDLVAARAELLGNYKNLKERKNEVPESSLKSQPELTEHLLDFAQFIKDDVRNLVTTQDDSFENVLLCAAKKFFSDRPLL